MQSQTNRVRVFRKENGGAYQTRLYGSAHAVGEHLLFIDADDYYVNNSVFRYLYDEALKTQCDVLQFRSYKKYNHLKYAEKARGGTKIVKGEAFLNDEYPRLLCSFWDKSSLGSNVAYKLYKKSLFENAPDYKTAELIRQADANAYISAAKSYKKNTGVKEKLKSVAKKIYRTI